MTKKPNNNPDVFLQVEAALAVIPNRAATVLFMRHGEKEPLSKPTPPDVSPMQYDDKRELTARGKTDSKIMGRLLMNNAVQIEHSVVLRCRQTAEHLACGAQFVRTINENPMLNGAGFAQSKDARAKGKQLTGGYSELIDRLAGDDYFPGFNPMRPFMSDMATRLLSAAKPGINVSISHDGILYLMLVALGIETKPFKEEHINYLEPLFLWQENGHILFHYRGKKGICSTISSNPAKNKQ